jgi:ankyrin repeat protein
LRDASAGRIKTNDELVHKYIKFFASQGADVNAKDDNWGETPLHIVAEKGDIELAKLLISKGADVNAGTITGTTPLYYATRKGNIEIVKFLVSKGANVNDRDALSVAAEKNELEVVQFLVSKGAVANQGALFRAVENGNIEIVKFLVSKGADVNAKTDIGETPLDWAKKRGQTAIVQYLTSVGGKSGK